MVAHLKDRRMYELPDMDSICEMNISKEQWKIKTKTAVKKYWSATLRLEAAETSTLQYCNISCLGIGQTHPVWDPLESTRLEVRRGVVKSRIVNGTYIEQSTHAKFIQYQVDSTCPLCHLEDEYIIHMVLRCSVLHSVRKGPFKTLKDYVISRTSEALWKSVFFTKINITRLIIDCSQIEELHSVKDIIFSTLRSPQETYALLYTKRGLRN